MGAQAARRGTLHTMRQASAPIRAIVQTLSREGRAQETPGEAGAGEPGAGVSEIQNSRETWFTPHVKWGNRAGLSIGWRKMFTARARHDALGVGERSDHTPIETHCRIARWSAIARRSATPQREIACACIVGARCRESLKGGLGGYTYGIPH